MNGAVASATFGHERYINQRFYASREWRQLRSHIFVRDNGCDLGLEDYGITTRPIVHHIVPMNARNLRDGDSMILDPENLITTCHETHNAIHYGDESLLPKPFTPRSMGDTTPWKRTRE